MEPQNVVIRYVFDTDDVNRARADLYRLEQGENDLVEEFKRVNAEAQKQAAALLKEVDATKKLQGAQQGAAGDQIKALGKLQILTDRLTKAEQNRFAAVDDAAVETYNKEIDAINKEIAALDKLGRAKKGGTGGGAAVAGEASGLGNIFRSLGPLIAGAFAVDKLIDYAKQIVSVTAEFQKFRAVLTNTLGTAAAADKVLAQIQLFASKTPFSVKELTQDFIKLANTGFKPTADELRKLGDLASSQGKSFDQLTEGIIDAQTGEFERLKEFGIRASKSGDQVTFTFKGIKTTVASTDEAIRKYILSLGDLKGVSGSMAAISGTLEGQFSNLGDTVDSLFLSIGKKIAPAVGVATSAIGQLATALTDRLNNGTDKAIRGNTELVQSLSPLLDRYDALKAKTSLSAKEQAEMKDIIAKVGAEIPTAITQFDAYGHAIDISTEAGRNFVKQQILVNEQLNKKELTTRRAEYRELTASIESTTRALALLIKGQKIAADDRAKFVAQPAYSTLPEYAKGEKEYQASLVITGDKIKDLQTQLEGLKNTRVGVGGIIDQLKGIAPALDEAGDAAKKTTVALGLLGALQKQLADAQKAQPGITNVRDLAANEVLIGSLQKRIKVLEELGTAYGALGRVNKQLADEEAARSTQNERQLAASAVRIEALKEEKKRLEELGTATGLVGELQKQISGLNERIPKIKVEADVREAYAELDRLNEQLDNLRAKPVKFTVKPDLDGADNFAAFLKAEIQKQLDTIGKGGAGLVQFADELNTAFLGSLNDQLKRGDISVAEYNAKRLQREKALKKDILQTELNVVDQQLAIQGLSYDQTRELEKKKNDILKQLYGEDAENYKAAQDKKREIEQNAMQAGIALVNQYFAVQGQRLAEQYQNSQESQAYEIELAGNTAGAKNKIDKKYKEQQDQIRKQQSENAFKQAVFERGLALAKIGIDTAKGVMAVLSTGGGTSYADFGISAALLSGLVIATGAAQAALVLSQPIQKFAKGTRFVNGPGSETSDSVPAMLSRGEGVMPAKVNQAYGPTFDAAYYGAVPPEVLNKFVLDYPNYKMRFPEVAPGAPVVVNTQEIGPDLLDAISRQPQNFATFDENGFSSHTKRRENIKRTLNRRIAPNG